MITRLKLKPGQKGTKLVDEFGDALVCVRYRYDRESGVRVKTAEIIVEKKARTPQPAVFPDNALVPVQIGFTEDTLRAQAKAAQERWDPDAKLWFTRFDKIKGTDLEKHIVLDATINR